MKVDLSEFKTDELWLVTGALMRILPIDEDEVLELELNSEVKTKHKYFLTAIMRASAFYNINDHFYLGATALLNNMRFDSEDNVKLQMKDWIVNAQFGIRF